MLRLLISILFFGLLNQLLGQYAPAAGQMGSTAISKESSIFTAWANACVLERSWQNISDTTLGKTTYGTTQSTFGKADNNVVSLGDGGIATLTFAKPIYDGPSWDFAVFENSFNDVFLELAFVEVSSDGQNFFRFPSHSLTQLDSQITAFGEINTVKINNLAGKYRGGYGTPFNLTELENIPNLDINNITHIRIIDVIGSIDTAYGSIDTAGNLINDPFPTPYASSGFDLDAVGVINSVVGISKVDNSEFSFSVYPNPASDIINIRVEANTNIIIYNQLGAEVYRSKLLAGKTSIDISNFSKGVYFIGADYCGTRFVRMFVCQ